MVPHGHPFKQMVGIQFGTQKKTKQFGLNGWKCGVISTHFCHFFAIDLGSIIQLKRCQQWLFRAPQLDDGTPKSVS